jgi:hypothetical protein
MSYLDGIGGNPPVPPSAQRETPTTDTALLDASKIPIG